MDVLNPALRSPVATESHRRARRHHDICVQLPGTAPPGTDPKIGQGGVGRRQFVRRLRWVPVVPKFSENDCEGDALLVVHMTLEHPNAGWGGIGTAVDLMTSASLKLGLPTAVISPAMPSVAPLAGGVIDLRAVVAGFRSPADVYGATDRVARGVRVAAAMADVLKNLDLRDAVVLVHHEELLSLFDLDISGGTMAYFSHGVSEQEHPDNAELIELGRTLARRRIATCAASRSQAALIETLWGVPANLVRLPLACLLDEPFPAVPRSRGVISAGRMVPQKGFDILIRAIAAMSDQIECSIIAGHGDRGYELECRRLAVELGVNVRWIEWTDRHDLRRRMASTALVAMPSRFEPLGLVAAEAIAVGTPVVGFDVGGLGELLSTAGQDPLTNANENEKVALLAERLKSWLENSPPSHRLALRNFSPEQTQSDLESARIGRKR
jgi:glycosyltransferase involved in cell wall biosynthesis